MEEKGMGFEMMQEETRWRNVEAGSKKGRTCFYFFSLHERSPDGQDWEESLFEASRKPGEKPFLGSTGGTQTCGLSYHSRVLNHLDTQSHTRQGR